MPDDDASSADPGSPELLESGPLKRCPGGARIRVMLPLPLPQPLDYLVPEGAALPAPGSFVRVPLAQRSLAGVVWDEAGDGLPIERLKPILEVLAAPALRPELRRFV